MHIPLLPAPDKLQRLKWLDQKRMSLHKLPNKCQMRSLSTTLVSHVHHPLCYIFVNALMTTFFSWMCAQSAGIISSTDDALGPILFRPCTPGDIPHCPAINPRPQRLTKRPAMYVSPFKGDPQRAKVPLSKALAVRKKFKCRMTCLRYCLWSYSQILHASNTHLCIIPYILVMFSSAPTWGNSVDQTY